ncbi:putative F-box/kelch-repeat protein-like isoform X2 [Capsicum annuum]|nr:putative F-box/kelch-repeat protein-like isoform X2 [Capsicum annuum]
MESQGDEAVPKWDNPFRFPSISSEDSVLPMPNLPAELITEILLRLPVKSLLKFTSVCKSWLSLISSPEFVKNHLLLSATNKDYNHHGVMFNFARLCEPKQQGIKDCSLTSLLNHPVTEAFDLDYPDKTLGDFPRLVGSVNGLVCLAMTHYGGLIDLFLWNPSIRKHKKLPNYRPYVFSRYLEDEYSDYQFGFAYDELQDDYKVVGRVRGIEVKIYSLRSDSWRLDRISSIDLANEKWAVIEKPCNFKGGRNSVMLGVLRSDLSVFCNYLMSLASPCRADIWVMKEYGVKESWTKMFTVISPDVMSQMRVPPILMSNDLFLKLAYILDWILEARQQVQERKSNRYHYEYDRNILQQRVRKENLEKTG